MKETTVFIDTELPPVDPGGESSESSSTEERLLVLGEIGRGGMGSVLKVWDTSIRREMAMKVVLGSARSASDSSPVLRRFLREARITGQLSHPGVVPIHELGRDAAGEPYFTMPLVRGRTLHQFIADLHRPGRWEQDIAAGLRAIVQVCEAVGYAHARKVIHRDLKPANVMIGAFGEVYVMDWGIAGLLDSAERARETDGSGDVDSRLTLDGKAIGTPQYMPPEQACGGWQQVGVHSDVYSIGAMLYHLLAGVTPYYELGAASPEEILREVRNGPPLPLGALTRSLSGFAGRIPQELEAIADKAMSRAPEDRYPSAKELGDDLQAYLDVRVVRAYRSGPLAELRKWVQRNRGFAGSIAAGVTSALLISLIAIVVISGKNERLLSLADGRRLEDLKLRAERLWPPVPESVPAMLSWIEDARPLVSNLEQHRATLADLGGSGVGYELQSERLAREELTKQWQRLDDVSRTEVLSQKAVPAVSAKKAEIESVLAAHAPLPTRADSDESWRLEKHNELVRAFDEYFVLDASIERMERRVSAAQDLARFRHVDQSKWKEAADSIADSVECPLYRGLRIEPQLGLVPIRRDPASGLWEFLHYLTGDPPEVDPDTGRYVLSDRTGLVLVLIPGGSFLMGEENEKERDLGPVHEVTLSAFFLSKYEMTQAQWTRSATNWIPGNAPTNPSAYDQRSRPDVDASLLPVERVSWFMAQDMMSRLGLVLPTEARWEFAVRAGSTSKWWFGDEPALLVGIGNVADASLKRVANPNWQYAEWDDGHATTAPVDAYEANPFGLHNVHGNVFEWCFDGFGGAGEEAVPGLRAYEWPTLVGSGERVLPLFKKRVTRGGAYIQKAELSRSAYRGSRLPTDVENMQGVRPARDLVEALRR